MKLECAGICKKMGDFDMVSVCVDISIYSLYVTIVQTFRPALVSHCLPVFLSICSPMSVCMYVCLYS